MKKKMLIITPRIPASAKSIQDNKLHDLMNYFMGAYEVHVAYIQTLASHEQTVREMEANKVKIISLREVQKTMKVNNYLELFLRKEKYDLTVLTNSITAKYYLPSLVRSQHKSLIVIDARNSQFVFYMKTAQKGKDFWQTSAYVKYAEIYRKRELPFYMHADIVIVDSEDDKKILEKELPGRIVAIFARPAVQQTEDRIVGEMEKPALTLKDAREERLKNIKITTVIVKTGSIVAPDSYSSQTNNRYISDKNNVIVIEDTAQGMLVEKINAGLRQVTDEYALVLADTTTVPEETVKRMVFCAECNPSHVLIVPISNVDLGPIVLRDGVDAFIPLHQNAHFGNWDEVKDYRQTMGMCFLVRKSFLKLAGLLDTQLTTLPLTIYDLALRASQAGCRALVNNEAFVYYNDVSFFEDMSRPKKKRDLSLLYEKWCNRGMEFSETKYE